MDGRFLGAGFPASGENEADVSNRALALLAEDFKVLAQFIFGNNRSDYLLVALPKVSRHAIGANALSKVIVFAQAGKDFGADRIVHGLVLRFQVPRVVSFSFGHF